MNRRAFKGILFFLTALLVPGIFLGAQETPATPSAPEGDAGTGPALLLQGPELVRGLPFLGDNAIPARRGSYGYKGARVLVYYTQEAVMIPSGWEEFDCRGTVYRKGVYDGGWVYARTDPQGWSEFVFFGDDTLRVCDFLETFLSRFNYFRGLSGTFSFPAVLEIP